MYCAALIIAANDARECTSQNIVCTEKGEARGLDKHFDRFLKTVFLFIELYTSGVTKLFCFKLLWFKQLSFFVGVMSFF